MAFYDNKHWLLSHVRTSFISSDDTGMSEDVMIKDNFSRQLEFGKYETYPGVEESDEDELDLARSIDVSLGVGYGPRSRPRSNTAARLQKLDEAKKKASTTRHVKWEKSPVNLSDEDKKELFKRKDFREKKKEQADGVMKQSLLVKQLENYPYMPQNPFQEYAKYDGNAQVGVATRRYGIYLTMLAPQQRSYPMHVVIIATARVLDLIGLVCWRCTLEHSDTVLKESVDYYSLYIAEDDGEVDSAFPCLDARETVAKFGFGFLALVERDPHEAQNDNRFASRDVFPLEQDRPNEGPSKTKVDPLFDGSDPQMRKLQGDMNAIDATLYQSYQVNMINRVTKTEMHLGISGEKVELYPAVHKSPRFWPQPKAATYNMDYVVACDLTETKSHSKSMFRLVYDYSNGEGSTGTFKSYDFEADHKLANEIVQKVNHILELRPSTRRKDYIAMRERKSHRRKSVPIWPR